MCQLELVGKRRIALGLLSASDRNERSLHRKIPIEIAILDYVVFEYVYIQTQLKYKKNPNRSQPPPPGIVSKITLNWAYCTSLIVSVSQSSLCKWAAPCAPANKQISSTKPQRSVFIFSASVTWCLDYATQKISVAQWIWSSATSTTAALYEYDVYIFRYAHKHHKALTLIGRDFMLRSDSSDKLHSSHLTFAGNHALQPSTASAHKSCKSASTAVKILSQPLFGFGLIELRPICIESEKSGKLGAVWRARQVMKLNWCGCQKARMRAANGRGLCGKGFWVMAYTIYS